MVAVSHEAAQGYPAMKFRISALSALLGLLPLSSAFAATATAQFNVQIQINSECIVTSATDLNFGPHGVLAASVDSTSTIGVQCTSGTGYTVGLNAGGGAGATVAARRMTGPSAQTVQYTLYRDGARTQLWGNTAGTDTVAGTGNGAAQTLTVFGRVPAQTTPGAGAYADIITVTVTY